jgi:DNA-binding GntR family transcriptional regulator
MRRSPGWNTDLVPREQDPPYRRIAGDIAAKITSGELRPGDQVPSATEICDRYGVTRNTALRALRALADDGLIVRQQGWGSFVAGNLN